MITELRLSFYYRTGRPNYTSARGDETPIMVSFPIVLESTTKRSNCLFDNNTN